MEDGLRRFRIKSPEAGDTERGGPCFLLRGNSVGAYVLLRIPAKSNSIPEGSRTPFRAEAEQDSGMIPNTNRSVATLAF